MKQYTFLRFSTFIFLHLFICFEISAQQLLSQQLKAITEKESELELFIFKPDVHLSAVDFVKNNLAVLSLAPNSEMRMIRSEKDDLGFTNIRYQQYINQYKIKGAEMVIHEKEGRIQYINGMYLQEKPQESSLHIDENQGLQIAFKQIQSTDYLWLHEDAEAAYKKTRKDSTASLYPKGELMYISLPSHAMDNKVYRLCWKYNISVEPATESYEVYIDAETGEVVNKIPLTFACQTGTSTTLWNGPRSIQALPLLPIGYILLNTCNISAIHTLNGNGNDNGTGATEYIDDDNNWPNTALGRYVAQTHFGAQQTRNYYVTIHGREGYDNNGHEFKSYLNPGFTGNAFYRYATEATSFGGTATGGSPYITLDVSGHEHTHGMVHFTSDLTYAGESGALNESFADCLGEAIEAYTLGTPDWVCAGELDTIRSFINPNDKGQPDTYLGTNWIPQSGCVSSAGNDFCGVHTNSGVQNYWFYLLSVGGGGTNDLGLPYCVSGIGIAKARMIAYDCMINLTSGSGYGNARLVSIQAAKDRYGINSNEALQTANAWAAVGVGPAQSLPPNPSVTISASANNFCIGTVASVTFTATPLNVTSPTYQWIVNGNIISGANGNTYTLSTLNNKDSIRCLIYYTPACPLSPNNNSSNTIKLVIHKNSGNAEAVMNDTSVCQGSLINIQASQAYCQPAYNFGTSNGDYINQIYLNSVNIISGASSAPYYTPPTSSIEVLVAGGSSASLLVYGGISNTANYIAAWIDFNGDKSFDLTERIGQSSVINSPNGGAGFYFLVPITAVSGLTRLRVRMVYGQPNIDPCSKENYGETEDYTVFIAGGTGIQSTPSFTWTSINTSPTSGALVFSTPLYSQAYTVQSTDAFGCTSSFTTPPVLVNSFNLQATSSPNVVCQGNSATLTVNTASNYCQPIYFNGTNLGDYISQIALWDQSVPPFGNFILSNSSGASNSPYYNLFPASGSTTATLQAGNSYTFYLYCGNSPGNSIAAFIDYNGNGNLDAGLEKIGNVAVTYPNASALTFTVPTWAHNGITRLRLRLNQGSNIQSCSSYDWGETEDYIITITGGVTPAPYTYAWLPSTNPITANTVSAIPSTSTEYAVVATDAIGCTATTKTSVMVATPPGYYLNNANPQWICAGDTTMLSVIPNPINYCEPTIANGTGLGDFISNVTIQGTTLSSTTGASSSPYRTLYPQSGSTTATLTAGNTYLMYVSNGTFTSLNNIAAWIDFDGDGNYFEPSEKIGESGFINSAYGVGTITFKIPTWAKNGTTRLRVREAYGNLELEACNSTYPDGELEDYLITITGGVAPTTYSWNPLGGSSTSASTFIMPTYTQTYTLTASDGYNCANTATITAYVNSPTVQATASSSSLCLGGSTTLTANNNYCSPIHSSGNTSGDFIEAVSLDGTSLNNTSGVNTSSYTLYNATGNTTTTLTAGNTYTLTVTVGTRNVGNTFAAWMDFDRNHELNNGFEKLGEDYNLNGNSTATIIFTIPAWANDGISRLRICETYFTPGILACGTNMYGETEDYPITIIGGLYAPAPTYVWNDDLNTSNTTLNVTPNYSTQYVITATDGNGCSKTSAVDVQVNSVPTFSMSAMPAAICAGSSVTLMANYTLPSTYCNPQTFNGNSGGQYINQVSIQGTTLNNTSGANANPFYFLYPASGSTTANLIAGNTYTLSVVMGSNCCNNHITAWIDYNQNYSFEAGVERIAALTNIAGYSVHNISFTVPSWAKNGSVRLRVREAFNIPSMNACTTYGQGETEDYVLTIANGVNTQPLSITWNPTTSPANGQMVLASPTATTTYTATLTDQYGCSNSATQTVSMNTLASFSTNAYQSCVDSTYTFDASTITCSGNSFIGNGTSYGATLLNSWAMTQISNFTIEAWVKWNGSTGSNQIICYNGNSTTNGYGIMVSAANANKLAILCGGSVTLNTNITLSVGVWQHLVIKRSPTITGGFWNIYVDGVSYNPSPNTGIPIAPTTGGTYVGRGFIGNYFNGSIDEVRFWNTMLSNAQISTNKIGCITAPQSNLVGYWKFNESNGSTICSDASGGNRTLTLSNALARGSTASYAWNYGDGNTGTGISSSHNYLTTGNKNVTLTVTDITGCYANDFQTIYVNHCYKTLSLKLFLQGYYLSGTQTMTSALLNQGQNNTSTQTDTVTVELHDVMMPQNIIATSKGVVNTDGTIACNFYNLPSNIMGYYIAVKHRNSIETWSNGMLMFNYMNQANYDFTTAASQAYGSNQTEVEPSIWAFYSGDINQDENADLLDASLLETSIANFDFGYFATDLNGDGNVDLLDSPMLEVNVNAFIYSMHP